MRFSSTAFSLITLATSTLAALNTSAEYYLRSEVKPGQADKSRYNNLWIVGYHTGAGFNDAVFYPNSSSAIKGFLNSTNLTQSNGKPYYHQEFDLGNDFPWAMTVSDVNQEAAWEPVRINVGLGQSAFFINSTGLQWSDEPTLTADATDFAGWLICDWWHGVPQLFAKWKYYNVATPSSCADINLMPVYLH